MENNFTIHIFGYGETQIVSKNLNFKTKTTDLTTVQTVIDEIFSKKPQDSQATIDGYHAINIFNYNDVRWIQKDEKSFNLKKEETLKTYVDALIAELQEKKDSQA